MAAYVGVLSLFSVSLSFADVTFYRLALPGLLCERLPVSILPYVGFGLFICVSFTK